MGASLVVFGIITLSSEDSNLQRNFFEELFSNIFNFFGLSSGSTGTNATTASATTSRTTAKTKVQSFQVQATQPPVTRVSSKKPQKQTTNNDAIFSTK